MRTLPHIISILLCFVLLFLVSTPRLYDNRLFFDIAKEPLYKLVYLALTLLVLTESFSVGLLLALVLMLIVTIVPLYDEKFSNGKPVSDCDNYVNQQINHPQGAFYPLH
jgi:hypothetical protein